MSRSTWWRQPDGSAEGLATTLARGMRFFDDRGFYKRAQITANDLSLAGVADFHDLDRLTIFADNLVPHVLRIDGVLRYDESLAHRIDSGELLPAGDEEREIRACAVHACESIADELGVAPRTLDVWLWNRGQVTALQGGAAPPDTHGLLLSRRAGDVRSRPVVTQPPGLAARRRIEPRGRSGRTSAPGSGLRPVASASRPSSSRDSRGQRT